MSDVVIRHFEAVKYALRQSKDGTIVSFVIHPNDVSSEMVSMPIGSRLKMAWTEPDDLRADDVKPAQAREGDGPTSRPLAGNNGSAMLATETGNRGTAGTSPPQVSEANGPPSKPLLSVQCALTCKDQRFWAFLANKGWISVKNEWTATTAVKKALGVDTRAALDLPENVSARGIWQQMYAQFQQSQTDEKYKDHMR